MAITQSTDLRSPTPYEAVLIVSFGGPEKPEDVMPFLENVVRGRHVPRARLLQVAQHYQHFGGKSPITEQNYALASAVEDELRTRGSPMPVYVGARNWHPLLRDTIARMHGDGVRRALAFFPSAFSSYSSCRQYRENISEACRSVKATQLRIPKLRAYYDHPLFIEANAAHLSGTLERIPAKRRHGVHVAFTAHSLPMTMANRCEYARQLLQASQLVADAVGVHNHAIVYQSRSGSPDVPWLGPDILDHLSALAKTGTADVIVLPIGFNSDHVEVLYDLDVEAADHAARLELTMHRAPTVGVSKPFVRMIADLIAERTNGSDQRGFSGNDGPDHDVCPHDCCPRA